MPEVSVTDLIADKEALTERVKNLTKELKNTKKELKEKIEILFNTIKEENESERK